MTISLQDAFTARGGKAFIPFIMGGDPDLETSTRLIVALAESGAKAIEIGVPFSDPIADGPVIQRASERALAGGTTMDGVLDACIAAAAHTDVPLVLFSYANPVLQYGIERLAQRAAQCGIRGLLLTDVPLEHAACFASPLRAVGVDMIQLATPTSSNERLRRIAALSSGFIYAVSRCGVTGIQDALSAEAATLVARLRLYTHLPIVLGFGISSRAHFEAACQMADGAVIGSALVSLIAENVHRHELVTAVKTTIGEWTGSPAAAGATPGHRTGDLPLTR